MPVPTAPSMCASQLCPPSSDMYSPHTSPVTTPCDGLAGFTATLLPYPPPSTPPRWKWYDETSDDSSSAVDSGWFESADSLSGAAPQAAVIAMVATRQRLFMRRSFVVG